MTDKNVVKMSHLNRYQNVKFINSFVVQLKQN